MDEDVVAYLNREMEYLLISDQNDCIRMNYIKTQLNKTQLNRCRQIRCKKRNCQL